MILTIDAGQRPRNEALGDGIEVPELGLLSVVIGKRRESKHGQNRVSSRDPKLLSL